MARLALLTVGAGPGVRRVAAARFSAIDKPTVMEDRATSHLDPLVAAPRRNGFPRTVLRFLGGLPRSR